MEWQKLFQTCASKVITVVSRTSNSITVPGQVRDSLPHLREGKLLSVAARMEHRAEIDRKKPVPFAPPPPNNRQKKRRSSITCSKLCDLTNCANRGKTEKRTYTTLVRQGALICSVTFFEAARLDGMFHPFTLSFRLRHRHLCATSIRREQQYFCP